MEPRRRSSTSTARPLVLGLVFALVVAPGFLIASFLFDEQDREHESKPSEGGKAEPVTSSVTEPDQMLSDAETSDRGNAVAEPSVFESDDNFWWLWAEPSEIRLVWRDESGAPYGQMQLAVQALMSDGHSVLAITNGGIYQPGLVPAGLYIENGREEAPLNQADGGGNFYLKPNGVFWLGQGEAKVDTTADFASTYVALGPTANGVPIDWAVQSGPMLVVDGAVSELFTRESASRHVRNAVAVDEQGRVLLIRSRGEVTMFQMADHCLSLGAVNVLYLDGTISRLDQVSADGLVPLNIPLASMIVVVDDVS